MFGAGFRGRDVGTSLSAFRSVRVPVLPSALRSHTTIAAFHGQGIIGSGVTVALLDTGVNRRALVRLDGYGIEGSEEPGPGHGTGMAAVLLSVAPGIRLISVRARGRSETCFEDALLTDADIHVCAWGSPTAMRYEVVEPLAERLLAVEPAGGPWFPGAFPGVRSVGVASPWPAGPFGLEGTPHRWAGVSMSCAVAAGFAALLVQSGLSPAEALLRISAPGFRFDNCLSQQSLPQGEGS